MFGRLRDKFIRRESGDSPKYSKEASGRSNPDAKNKLRKARLDNDEQENNDGWPSELDLTSVPLYSLPPSPWIWEFEKKEPAGASSDLFEIEEGSHFELSDVIKLSKEEKPDPAFRDIAAMPSSFLYIDKNGRSSSNPDIQAALKVLNEPSIELSKLGLDHDIYRRGTSPVSNYFAFLSSSCVLCAYDDKLKQVFKRSLPSDIRVKSVSETTPVVSGTLKNHIRTVNVSPDGSRIGFTIIDKAFCVDRMADTIWAVSMPLQDGYERVTRQSPGLPVEVEDALVLMELSPPITYDQIKTQYRQLALRWHPDRNPDDVLSNQRMQKLNSAFATLTGTDLNSLEIGKDNVIEFRRTEPDQVISVGDFEISITVSGGNPFDWIYASGCSADGQHTYLGGYSGKIVKVDNQGRPCFVLDVGSVPREIIDVGTMLYVTTDTRAYIIDQDLKLVNFVDIYKEGKFVALSDGFALFSNKNLKLFSLSGVLQNHIRAKHPIRAFYIGEEDIVVETRQHRATFVPNTG
jgi:hypothetical protein